MFIIIQYAIALIFFILIAELYIAIRETIRRNNGYYENYR